MIVALIFAGYLLAVFGVAGIIVTGIHHVALYLERKNEEKETPSRYEKYRKIFKYNP
jgi:hypothetical protein